MWFTHARWVEQIERIRTQMKTDGHEANFHGLLERDLPLSEKTNTRMREEAQLLVLAEQDATAHTLCSLTYQIPADVEIFKKLRLELVEAIPDPDGPLNSAARTIAMPDRHP